jgi:ComF family protein
MGSSDAGVLRRLIHLMYPDNIYCMRCGDTIDPSRIHGLCDVCIREIPWAPENPFRSYMDEFAFDDVWPVARYGAHVRGMIHALKLHGQTYIAANLGKLLAERVRLAAAPYDLITAVPLHREKQKRRGYNQAALLAEYAAGELGAPYRADLLEKRRATGSMRLADSRTRRQMLAEAFRVPDRSRSAAAGRHLLLVDDVCTTGSTADACARALKEAGAARVTLLCFAVCAGYRKGEDSG